MSRGKKDQQVDRIEHRSGVIVDVFFDPNTTRIHPETGLTFSARVADKEFRDRDAEALKRKVREHLDSVSKLDWVPVIELTELHPFSCNNPEQFVGFQLTRYFLANSAETNQRGPVLRKLSWDDYVHEGEEPHSMFEKEYRKLGLDMFRIMRSSEFHGFHKPVPDCLPFTEGRRGDHDIFWMLYSEPLWASLEQIQEGIARLKRKLREMTSTPDGILKLTAMGAQLLNLLPESTGTEKPDKVEE